MSNEYSIIVDVLPTTVEIGGTSYDINTDFRTGILLEQLFADRELAKRDKLAAAVALYYPLIPDDLQEAMKQISWFHSTGKSAFSAKENAPQRARVRKPERRILDYDVDASMIYSAFLTQYGLDLQDVEYLHWWKFHAMLNGLMDDLPLSRIMMYRGTDLNTIKDAKLRRQYATMQAKYRLPSVLNDQEKVELAGQMFAPRGITK